MNRTRHERLRGALIEHMTSVTPGVAPVLDYRTERQAPLAVALWRVVIASIFLTVILLFFGAVLLGVLAVDACSSSSPRPTAPRDRTPAPTMPSSKLITSKARTSSSSTQ